MLRRTYYAACVVLGLLVGQLLHALLEIQIIELLIADFTRYGLGLSWETWFLIHHVSVAAFVLGGGYVGWRIAPRWWDIVYVQKRRG